MARKPADPRAINRLYELAGHPEKVGTTVTVEYDMMGRDLTRRDLCDALRHWIDEGKEVLQTVMRGKDTGRRAFETKPIINGSIFYCKFLVRDEGGPDERLYIISAHPDH